MLLCSNFLLESTYVYVHYYTYMRYSTYCNQCHVCISATIQFFFQRRQLVGSVIVQKKHLGVPGPYIPLFYQMQPVLSNFRTEGMKVS